jgi:hypothetical protein
MEGRWAPQEFIAPAAAWVFYLDELRDDVVMNADTCVVQVYRSLWVFSIGACVGFSSMGVAILLAWISSSSVWTRVVAICLVYFDYSMALGSRFVHVKPP